jgi:hypothetical protein
VREKTSLLGVNIYLGGADLTCLNGGICKGHQCDCSEHFMGHDCSISMRISVKLIWFL